MTLGDVFEFCENRNFKDILDTCLEVFALTQKPNIKIPSSLFNFSASLTLSGGNYPCESPFCRINRIRDLAIFSSLYSDRTTIYNPFDFVCFYLNPSANDDISDKDFRIEAMNAFAITLELRPLLERGLIVFSKTIYFICASCKKKKDKITGLIIRDLDVVGKKTLFPLIQDKLEIKYGEKSFHLQGIEDLIGDDVYFHYKEFPSFLTKGGKRINTIKDLKYNNPLIQRIIGKAIDSLMFQKLDGIENITQTYLTSNFLEKTLLEKIGKQSETKALNLFAKGLPVIQGVPLENIISTRDQYSDEFKSFQNRVSDLVNEGNRFETQEEFDSYVVSNLTGELNDLTKIQKEGKKKLRSEGFTEGAFLGASIAISVLSNSQAPGILGLAKACYDCTKLISEAEEIEKEVQKSPLFFYYKLNKLRV